MHNIHKVGPQVWPHKPSAILTSPNLSTISRVQHPVFMSRVSAELRMESQQVACATWFSRFGIPNFVPSGFWSVLPRRGLAGSRPCFSDMRMQLRAGLRLSGPLRTHEMTGAS